MTRQRTPEVTEKQRRAILQMKAGGASQRQIADTMGLSQPTIQRVLALEKKHLSVVREEVEASKAEAPPAGSLEGDIQRLEALVENYDRILGRTTDPQLQSQIQSKKGDALNKLGRLRIAQEKQREPAKESAILRVSHQAADKLRALVEEAIGESLAEDR